MFTVRELCAGEGEEQFLQTLRRGLARHPQIDNISWSFEKSFQPLQLNMDCIHAWVFILFTWTCVLFLKLSSNSSQDFPTHRQHPAHTAISLLELYCP